MAKLDVNEVKNRYINKKSADYIIRIVSVLVFMALFAFSTDVSFLGDYFTIKSGGDVVIAFYMVPFLLMGALYGYVIALTSFLLIFISVAILQPQDAYLMAIFLVYTICFSLFSQYFFFINIRKTIIAAASTAILGAVVEFLCLSVLTDVSFEMLSVSSTLMYLGRDIITIFAIAFLLYVFHTKAPDICKLPFYISIGYTKEYQENIDIQRRLRKTRVSVKITAIIVAVELILGISVSVFMSVLFPDMKVMLIQNYEQRAPMEAGGQQYDESDIEEFKSNINDMEYVFNYSTLNFDVKMILLMLCIGVPIAGIANYYTKSNIGEPLGAMSDFMYEYANAIDENKIDIGHKVDVLDIKNKDEIGVVYESICSTVHEMEAFIDRLKIEQKLQRDLEVAKKASEAKSYFLSNMSHEIRTPINAVLGMNELILRESKDEDIIEYACNVKSAGNSLLSLVNDILDFSKIEAGKMELLPVQYDVASLINDLINMIAAKASEKKLELKINVGEEIPNELFGDEVRIKQCVTNILTNAVKYTEEGSVTLNVGYNKLDEDNIGLMFQVVDTGIGIKEEDLSKLYSPFERIEEIRNRSIEGTGLGMSIVKKLLAMMDTKLVVKSVYGEGSDFSFEVNQGVVDWTPIGDFKTKYKEYIQSREQYREKFVAQDANVLVVDDTEINLTVFKGLLKNTKIQIDTATSGRETLEMIVKKRYDVIFLDHRMPQMDGMETLFAMKELPDNKNVDVPVIVLTANAVSGAKEEYLKAGFTDYLTKPVNGSLIEEMLIKYLPADKINVLNYNPGDEIVESKDSRQTHYLEKIDGVDFETAVENCGGIQVLENVIKDFRISIDDKADAIEKYYNAGDLKNYEILVHALKSSARLIGAMELSAQAAYLESCADNGNVDEIKAKTSDLLKLYRSYKEKLAVTSEDSDLPLISDSQLDEAFSNIKEMVEIFDFDTADSIMKMLEGYSIPFEKQEVFLKLQKLMVKVDREGILELLE